MFTRLDYMLMVGYGVPCALIYLYVVICIICSMKFNNFDGAFFKIAVMLGIIDLIQYIVVWITFKLPLHPQVGPWFLTHDGAYWMTVGNFLRYYDINVRSNLVAATAFNRLTALVFPLFHRKLWSRHQTHIILLCFVTGIIGTWQVLIGDTKVLPFSETSTSEFVIATFIDWYPVKISLLMVIYTILLFIMTLVFNAVTLGFLIRRKIVNKGNSEGARSRIELNLFIVTLFDFFCDLLFSVHQGWCFSFELREIYYSSVYDELYLAMAWVTDFITLARPFVLMIVSKKILGFFALSSMNVFTATSSNLIKSVKVRHGLAT